MTTIKIKYEFSDRPWQYNGPANWVFISLPEAISAEIREAFKQDEEGWGRLKAIAKVGSSEWKTSIWFDTKRNTYLLPLKADIRKKEKIEVDKKIKLTVWI